MIFGQELSSLKRGGPRPERPAHRRETTRTIFVIEPDPPRLGRPFRPFKKLGGGLGSRPCGPGYNIAGLQPSEPRRVLGALCVRPASAPSERHICRYAIKGYFQRRRCDIFRIARNSHARSPEPSMPHLRSLGIQFNVCQATNISLLRSCKHPPALYAFAARPP